MVHGLHALTSRSAWRRSSLRWVRGGFEFGGEDADRDAGRAVDAAGTVGDGLAAAETDPAERLVELARMAARKLGEHLPLDLARQIRARARVGHEEFRKAKWCAHPAGLAQMVTALFMRLVNADEKSSARSGKPGVCSWGEALPRSGTELAARVMSGATPPLALRASTLPLMGEG